MLQLEKNPYSDKDDQFLSSAKKVTDLLWETASKSLTSIPDSYLSSLDHEFSDGSVSMLSQLNKVDFSENITYEDYTEVVNSLIKVNPNEWPNPEFTEQIQTSKLAHNIEPDFEFSEEEFEFAEGDSEVDLTSKMELFFKKIISSVYLDGVTKVTDRDGNPPNKANNYLMDPDGKSFAGIFYDSPPNATSKKFPFRVKQKSDGKWQIQY